MQSSFRTAAKCTCTDTPFKTPTKDTKGRREQHRNKLPSFKTIDVHSIRVIREKEIDNRIKNMVNIRHRENSFKTMGKTRKKVSFQDMDIKIFNPVSFKALGKNGIKKVSFKTTDETIDNSFFFKTFDEWVKARHDMVLKNTLFHFRKEISPGEGEGFIRGTSPTSTEIQPQLQRARHLVDQKHW